MTLLMDFFILHVVILKVAIINYLKFSTISAVQRIIFKLMYKCSIIKYSTTQYKLKQINTSQYNLLKCNISKYSIM